MIDTSETFHGRVTLSGDTVSAELLCGRYKVIRQLGKGGMGSVWLAEDQELDGVRVALKMLPSILVSNRKAIRQLREEAMHWKKLSHENIAKMCTYEEHHGNPFLVIDYIDGVTLEDYLADCGFLSEAETVKLLAPIADALDYAHREGVVHRDVKPANIMIRRSDGKPFVLDFGIARELNETMTRVTGSMSSGTLMYMSPEQLHGADPDPRQDVYAFAALTYECLRGAPPFSRGQIEYQIDHDDPRPLEHRIAIAASVMRGLSKDPAERPDSCRAILTVTKAPPPARRLPAVSKSLPPWLVPAGFATLALFVCAGLVAWLVTGRRQDDTPHPNVITQVVSQVSKPVVITQVVNQVSKPVVITQVVSQVSEPIIITQTVERVIQTGTVQEPVVSAGHKVLRHWLTGNIAAAQQLLTGLSEAERAGDPDILFVEGQLNTFGYGVPINRQKATQLYLAAKAAGSLFGEAAELNVRIRASGYNDAVWAQLKSLEERLTPQAEAGDLGAQLWLGNVLAARNDESARVWWKKAEEGGSYQAELTLAAVAVLNASSDADAVQTGQQTLERYAEAGFWMADMVLIRRYGGQNDVTNAIRCYKRSETQINAAAADGNPDATQVEAVLKAVEGIYRLQQKVNATTNADEDALTPGQLAALDTSAFKAGTERRVNIGHGVSLILLWCPPGEFQMGSPTYESGRDSNEIQTSRRIEKGFWLGKYEVTQAQWTEVMGSNPSNFRNVDKATYPVDSVTLADCENFTRRLNARLGITSGGFRLPTSAEWEYACRAGTTGPWAVQAGAFNSSDRRRLGPTAAGSYEPNPWGFCDMHGNVAEWTPDLLPGTLIFQRTGRTIRGGSWRTRSTECRSAALRRERENMVRSDYGMRICFSN